MSERPKRHVEIPDYRERKKQKREGEVTKESIEPEEEVPAKQLLIVQEECRRLYNELKALKDESGRTISELFQQLPSRRTMPEYYEVIKNPIALNNIKSKIDALEYKSVNQFRADCEQMFTNAKKYNIAESAVYQYAKTMQQWMTSKFASSLADDNSNRAESGTPEPRTKSNSKIKAEKTIPKLELSDLMLAIDHKDSKKVNEMLAIHGDFDVNQLMPVELFDSEFTWSPLHSACYKGDVKIAKILLDRGAEVDLKDTWYGGTALAWAAFGEHEKVVRLLIEKYGADRNVKNSQGQVPFDLVSDKSEERWKGLFVPPLIEPSKTKAVFENETSPDHETTQSRSSRQSSEPLRKPKFDPFLFMKELWQIIVDHKDGSGREYSELFMELPSEKEYPEYFAVISKPIALNIIEAHINKRSYQTLKAFESDILQMFENAMIFNKEGSRVYKDAKLLQRLFLRQKEKQLQKLGIDDSKAEAFMKIPTGGQPEEAHSLKVKFPASFLQSQATESSLSLARGKINGPIPKITIKFKDPQTADSGRSPQPSQYGGAVTSHHRKKNGREDTYDGTESDGDDDIDVESIPGVSQFTFTPHYAGPKHHDIPHSNRPLKSIPTNAGLPLSATSSQYPQPMNGISSIPVVGFDNASSLTGRKTLPLFQLIAVESEDHSFMMTFDTNIPTHSMTLRSHIQSVAITPVLATKLLQNQARVSMAVVHSGRRLLATNVISLPHLPQYSHEVFTAQLWPGLNVIEIWVSAEVATMGPGIQIAGSPEWESQQYFLFVTKT